MTLEAEERDPCYVKAVSLLALLSAVTCEIERAPKDAWIGLGRFPGRSMNRVLAADNEMCEER